MQKVGQGKLQKLLLYEILYRYMKRLFVAVKFYPDKKFIREYKLLRSKMEFSRIRWVEPDKFHITLKFIGDTSGDSLPDVIAVIKNAAKHFDPFYIEVGKLGVFGSNYNPRIIWLGINNQNRIKRLGEAMLLGFENAGYKVPSRFDILAQQTQPE